MTDPHAIPEITAEELISEIESGDAIQVLDVRPAHRLANGHIDLLPEDRFFNMAGPQVMALEDPGEIGIDKNRPVAVVCGHGNSSKHVTMFLDEKGYQARSVRGGMAAWMMSGYPRDLAAPPGLDRLTQFDRVGKGSLAYLLASDGEALVIDPARNTEPYRKLADEIGARIVGVADTHVHADYISGGPALSAELNVPYYLHPSDNAHVYERTPGKLDITPVEDGSVIQVGRCAVDVVHTPGHTEGSVTYRIGDAAAFTGDFLFVRSIGRPDLGEKIDSWTGILWNSVVRAKETFPDGMAVYPAHYSSDSERREDRSVWATFGEIRSAGGPLAIASETEFAEWVKAHVASFPDAYRQIKVINVGLMEVSPEEADELEVGKNECAVG